MIIVCQRCTQRYHLDPISLGEKGRKVRCASCGEVWFQESTMLPQDLSLEDKPLLPSAEAPSFVRRFSRLFLKILFVFGLLFGGFFAFSALGIKQWLIGQVPQLEQLFGMMESSAQGAQNGLEVRQVSIEPVGGLWQGTGDDGKKLNDHAFMIKGNVVNTSSQAQPLPPLKIQLQGKCAPPDKGPDCVLQEWTHALSQSQILPGEVIQFEISLEHSHPPSSSLLVSF